jgi:hypothetical protein
VRRLRLRHPIRPAHAGVNRSDRTSRSSPGTWCNSRRNASSRLIAQLAISSAGTTSSTSGSASMSASVSGRECQSVLACVGGVARQGANPERRHELVERVGSRRGGGRGCPLRSVVPGVPGQGVITETELRGHGAGGASRPQQLVERAGGREPADGAGETHQHVPAVCGGLRKTTVARSSERWAGSRRCESTPSATVPPARRTARRSAGT